MKKFIFFVFPVILFGAYMAFEHMKRKNLSLYQFQASTQKSFGDYAKTVHDPTTEIKISSLTPFQWDYVLSVNQVVSGKEAVQSAINAKRINIRLSNYTILDEKFAEHNEGLVFVNMQKKFILTIPLSTVHSDQGPYVGGFNNACLVSTYGQMTNKYFAVANCQP